MDLEGWFVILQHLVISDANTISKIVTVVQKWIVGKTGLSLVTFDGNAMLVNSQCVIVDVTCVFVDAM